MGTSKYALWCESYRWVMRLKLRADGEIERYKARLVAKGYNQKEGFDYKGAFSPVARFDTIRSLLSVTANEGLSLVQFDVKTAFLNGDLEKDIYMTQPDGYSAKGMQIKEKSLLIKTVVAINDLRISCQLLD